MSHEKIGHDELLQLLSGWCNGELSEQAAEKLATALRDDPEARQVYLDYMDLNAALAWDRQSLDQYRCSPAAASSAPTAANSRWNRITGPLRDWLHRSTDLITTPVGISFAMAGLAVILLVGLLGMMTVPEGVRRRAEHQGAEQVIAARIVGGEDCRWDEVGLPVGVGSVLYKGQRLKLREGLSQIKFDSGATVVLTGPTEFLIDTSSAGTLHAGRLSAEVPPAAKGFAISTPRSIVTDYGTEFGVAVLDDGQEEIHVFSGLVEVSFPGNGMAARRLQANEALRVPAGEIGPETLVAMRAEPRSFVRKINPFGDTTVGTALPPEERPPVGRGLTLWLSGDGAVRLDGQGRVALWGDMLAGENQRAQNAWQNQPNARPRWIADAVAGKPALRFDGNNFLMLPTPSDLGILGRPYEMFVVVQSSSPATQFLIAGGVEEFEIHLNHYVGARYIPAGYLAGNGSSDLAAEGAFTDGRPHVVAARVSPPHDHRGILQVDGLDSRDLTTGDVRSVNNAPLRVGQRQNGVMGMEGDIAEVLIFRGALTNEERQSIHAWLSRKYSIATRSNP